MSTTTITLSSGTSLSSGGNSGYRLAAGTTAYTPTGTYKYTSPSYPIKITAVSVPWFGYSSASSNITVSGTITVKIGSATFTGTLSSTTLKTNTNVTGTVSCTGSAVLATNSSYTVSVTCSGSNLLKAGTRFATNGKNLTGTWAANTYTITYKPGSSSTGSNYTQTKTAGTTLTLRAATYSRTGYHQTGWATSDGGAQAYALSGSYTANAAATLYPVWTSYKANVTYNVNGGTITTGTGTTRYRVSGSTVQVSSNSGSTWSNLTYSFGIDTTYPNHWNVATYGATRTGYYITGTEAYGTTSSGGILINQDYSSSSTTNAATVYRMNGNANLTADKNFTLYIHWKPNTYTVTFNRNGGPANGSSSVTATYNAAMPSATMPTRAGYTFNGYYDAASGGTQYYTATGASARTWNKTSNATLYAHWTKNSYNLTLNCTSGSYQILPYDRDISNWSKFRLNENQWLAKNKDGYFASGQNNVTAYNFGEGSSTVTRIAKRSDNPFSNANYELQVDVVKAENANARKGFVQSTTSAASKVFQHIFVAKLQSGYKFQWAANATGDNCVVTWLTPREGTGEYEVYAYQMTCGSTGTFSTFGHVYVQTDEALNLTFYVAYSEMFDISKSQVFSVPYNTVTSSLPIPVRPGYKFVGWGRSFNGSQQGTFGRDMYYTDKICIHFKAYMDNWQLYGSTPMRMISCTEGGGWNIEPSASGDSYQFNFLFYDAGASGYKSTLSNTLMSDLAPGWHTFDMIFDGTNVRGYIDGVLEGTSANFSGAIGYNSTNGLFVGCESVSTETTGGAPYFTGHMTSPLIWHGTSIQGENNTQITMPAGSWTLTSYWESEAQSSTLTLDPDGGTISSTSVTNSIGSLTTLPTPTKAGYKFKGWYYELDGHRYASYSRNLMFDSALSIHLDAYLDDWSQAINGTPLISCTETGGWNLYPSSDHMMSSLYDSGTNSYKDAIDSDHLVSDLASGWHSFDLVYNETWNLYIDNVLVASSTALTDNIGYNNYNSILIGAESIGYALDFDHSVQFFKGKIGNLRIVDSNQKIITINPNEFIMPAVDATVVAWWEEVPSYIKLYTISNNTPASTITNLTNTTWYFNEDLTNTTANAEYDITFNSNNTTYEQLVTVNDTYIVYNPDTVYYGGQKWFNENFRTIEITGGTDITSQQLISWLYDNATLYSSPQWVDIELQHYFSQIPTTITNLTNTVWILNNNLTIPHYMSTESTGGLRVRSDHSLSASEVTMIYPGDLVIFTGNIYNDGDLDWYELSNGWSVGMYLVDLNLEGNINFTSNNTNFATISLQNNVLNYITNEAPSTTINIYNNGYITDNYKTIEINGGNDVTNTTLISWLQNNATLQPILSFQSSPVKIYTPLGWQIVQS